MIVEVEEKIIKYYEVDIDNFIQYKATSNKTNFVDLIYDYTFDNDKLFYDVVEYDMEVLDLEFHNNEERQLKLIFIDELD